MFYWIEITIFTCKYQNWNWNNIFKELIYQNFELEDDLSELCFEDLECKIHFRNINFEIYFLKFKYFLKGIFIIKILNLRLENIKSETWHTHTHTHTHGDYVIV
jgi:hypothetical protein